MLLGWVEQGRMAPYEVTGPSIFFFPGSSFFFFDFQIVLYRARVKDPVLPDSGLYCNSC